MPSSTACSEKGPGPARPVLLSEVWIADYPWQMLTRSEPRIPIRYARRHSIGIDDMVVAERKAGLVKAAEKEVVDVESQYQDGPSRTASATTRSSEIGRKSSERVSDE